MDDTTITKILYPRSALVCGGRTFNDYDLVCSVLDRLLLYRIVEGGAQGADLLGRKYAQEHMLSYMTFPAQWAKYGKSAGPRRNKQMLEEGGVNLIVAFPGGMGTANMIRQGYEAGLEVIQVYTKTRQVILQK